MNSRPGPAAAGRVSVVSTRRREKQDQVQLNSIRVLKLVDEESLEAAVEFAPHGRVVDEQVSRSIQQIVKIEESFFALAVLPFRQEPLEQPLDQVVQTHLQRPGVFQFLETLSPGEKFAHTVP